MVIKRESVAIALELYPVYYSAHGKVKSVLRHGVYLFWALENKQIELKKILYELFIEELRQVDELKKTLIEMGLSNRVLDCVGLETLKVKRLTEKKTV